MLSNRALALAVGLAVLPQMAHAILKQHLSLRETMDIVMAVAWYNAVARMLKPMRIETESWFKKA
jgi:alkylhydroperoxidase family enzyme